jgi:amino acid transporter
LLELVVLFDMLAVGIGCGVSATRGIFAMAKDGRLPGPFAVVSKRRSSPLGATVFVTGFCAVALLADVFWTGLFALPGTPHYDALFSWGSTFGGFALVVVYLLMAIGSLRSFAHPPRRLWLVLSVVLAILITAGAIFGSFYKVTSPTVLAPWLALAVLVIGFASTWVTRARRAAASQSPAWQKSRSHLGRTSY